jgi:isopentenyl-diphosphate delta-isomerase
MDIARAIALGASAAGIARPVLRALASGGRAAVLALLDAIETELRAVMLLTGSRDMKALGRTPRVIVGELSSWLDAGL